MCVFLAAMFMAPAQMAYPTAYPSFPGVTPPNSIMGSMMPPPVGMVAQPGASGMVAPMAMPAGYMGGMQASMMGVPNGMMTSQQAGYMASMAAMPQTVYGVQPAQQLQWNLTQVSSLPGPGMGFRSFPDVPPGAASFVPKSFPYGRASARDITCFISLEGLTEVKTF